MASPEKRPLYPRQRLAVALDYPDAESALKLVDTLGDTCQWFKVGMKLCYAAVNAFVQQLRKRGLDVFLDLKLRDIPNTVAGAVRSRVAEILSSPKTVNRRANPAHSRGV
jgi:orotidine-5'-phosphate decarboxylase